MYVSANHTQQDVQAGKVDDIEIFRDQIAGWLFSQADRLSGDNTAAVAILVLVTPYFEAISSYLKGEESKNKAVQFLKIGLREVFPNAEKLVVDAFAKEIRHGLFHEAAIRRVVLHRGDSSFPPLGLVALDDEKRLVVDPWFVLETAKAHLATYVARLRDQPKEAKLLDRFNRFMKIRWGRWNK